MLQYVINEKTSSEDSNVEGGRGALTGMQVTWIG